MTDQNLSAVLYVLATTLAGCYLLVALARTLGRSRPGFHPVKWVLIAFALRVVSAAALSLTGIARTLRGGDEVFFLGEAHKLAAEPFSSNAWLKATTSKLHEVVFALQFRLLGDVPDLSLRAVQAFFGVTALLLLACAVYDLSSPRAGRIALVALAFEPTSMFFSTLLHKESLMLLAAAIVVFGGTLVWRQARLDAIALMVFGCLIGVGTRPYAGFFLSAGAVLVVLHGSLRNARRRTISSAVMLTVSIAFTVVAAPTVAGQTSNKQLQRQLQSTQNANTSDTTSNLALEQVDYSSRGAVVLNLPRRIRDITLRPYPWQLGNISQSFGLLGTLAFLATLGVLASALRRRRGGALAVSGPFVYVGALVLVGYALSAGNAGTGFRYRTHVVQLAICTAVALRWRPSLMGAPAAAAPATARGRGVERVRAAAELELPGLTASSRGTGPTSRSEVVAAVAPAARPRPALRPAPPVPSSGGAAAPPGGAFTDGGGT